MTSVFSRVVPVLLGMALLASTSAAAQAETQPANPAQRATFDARAEPDAIPLYGETTPGNAADENWLCLPNGDCTVRNVSHPTLTPVLPAPEIANGAAVIVLPGGGFMSLALDHEGHRVARALADRGIAAFVLKYRLLPTPAEEREANIFIGQRFKDAFGTPAGPQSLFNRDAQSDAEAALQLVRDRAEEWGIDPQRLGMIGFSAGARATLAVVMDSTPADRPRFFGYIYGDMASKPVPPDAPPMFAAIAFDDNLYRKGDLALAQNWHRAKRKVELHVYQSGGHGFGLGRPGTTNALLADQLAAWLTMQGFLTSNKRK